MDWTHGHPKAAAEIRCSGGTMTHASLISGLLLEGSNEWFRLQSATSHTRDEEGAVVNWNLV